MFTIPSPTLPTLAEQLATAQMYSTNQIILNLEISFKAYWEQFWDNTASQALMQAKLDFLASTPTVDMGVTTDSLSAYFAKTIRAITYIRNENPTSFADAENETTGALQPSGGPYQRYVSPGWVYSVDPSTGRFVVSVPCQF